MNNKFLLLCLFALLSNFSWGQEAFSDNVKYGFKDENGNVIIPPKYDDAHSFSEGLASVKLNGKWGYINKSGQVVIPLKYDAVAWSFSEGLASVMLNWKWGFINKSGQVVIPLKYDAVWYFSEGLAIVKLNRKFGYINKSGQVVIPLKYNVALSFSEGLAIVELNRKLGYINKSGQEVIPFKYDVAHSFSEGLARVNLNGKWGYVNKSGQEVIPFKYDDVTDFSEGLVRVKLNGKWGYVNKSGQEVIPLKYDDVRSFFEGLALVKLNGKWGFINKSDQEVIPFKYNDALPFSEGLAKVELNWKWGYINKKGQFFNTKEEAIIDYSDFAKKYVEKKVAQWQEKGEFEKTADYQIRVNEQARNELIKKLNGEVKNVYFDKIKNNIENDFVLGKYDSDNETFLITSKEHGSFVVNVPISEAQSFKNNFYFSKNASTLDFIDKDYNVGFTKVVFTSNYKSYASNANNSYAVSDISYNFAPIEIETQQFQTAQKQNVNVSQNTISVGKTIISDVDKDIPVTNIKNEKTFVVIIANENYIDNSIAKVDFALNDGRIFKEYCQKTLGIPSQNIKIVENGTAGIIRRDIRWLAEVLKVHKGTAKAIFYYAGHGIPNEATKEAYLLPVDGSSDDYNTALALSTIYKQLAEAQAKQITYFIDACFSGLTRDDKPLLASRGVAIKVKPNVILGNGVLFASTSSDQTAYKYEEKAHGMFTYFLLKKLRESKGNVKYRELSNYISDNVQKTSVVINSKLQTPTIQTSYDVENYWMNWTL